MWLLPAMPRTSRLLLLMASLSDVMLPSAHTVLHVPADTDVAYAVKPLWESYLELIGQYNADGAWQTENPSKTRCVLAAPPRRPPSFAVATMLRPHPCELSVRLAPMAPSLCFLPAVNSGHFVLLPTNASLAFAEAWVAAGPASLLQKVTDQKYLPELEGSHFVGCKSLCLCYRHKFKVRRRQGASH